MKFANVNRKFTLDVVIYTFRMEINYSVKKYLGE